MNETFDVLLIHYQERTRLEVVGIKAEDKAQAGRIALATHPEFNEVCWCLSQVERYAPVAVREYEPRWRFDEEEMARRADPDFETIQDMAADAAIGGGL